MLTGVRCKNLSLIFLSKRQNHLAMVEEAFNCIDDQSYPDGAKTDNPGLGEGFVIQDHADKELNGRADKLEQTHGGEGHPAYTA